MSDLHYLPAGEALARFRRRELSPVELLAAVIERAERVEPALGAFADRRYEQAQAEARAAEARYAGRGDPPRPLEGLPVALKEEHAWAGQALRMGSLVTGSAPQGASHPVVERVLDAGAIVHARTTTPEVSSAGFTHSRLWGVTRNPWQLERSPGGSSGGSGAALAAGTATLATGSDIAGSIRIPASMCGVVGFKPPHGRVPELPPYSLDPYCANGPMARTVADCALLANVLAGPDPRDAAAQRPALRLPDAFPPVAGLRIAVCPRPGDYPVEDDVAANAARVSELLRDAGADVEEVELGLRRRDVVRAAFAHYATLWGPAVASVVDEDDERAMPYTRALLRECAAVAATTSPWEGLVLEAAVWDEIGPVLERCDALVCPTLCVPALDAGEDYVERPLVACSQPLDHYFEMLLTIPFNIAGRCPVLALPSGLASDGVPTGIQVVGRTFDDPTVFRVGAALEAAGLGFGGDPAFRPAAVEREAAALERA